MREVRYDLDVSVPGVLLLVDRAGGGRPYTTITNAAEEVIEELGERGLLDGRRVLYQDTDGRWDELAHEGGRFRGFKPLGAWTREDALAALQAPHQAEGRDA